MSCNNRQIIWIDSIKCSNCFSDCEHIFWEDYINEIIDRYKNKIHSFLVVCRRNNDWEIVGFKDWYISDFDTIFEKEFYYYKNLWKECIKQLIEQSISRKINWNILVISALWTQREMANIDNIKKMMRFFFSLLELKQEEFDLCILELKLWSVVHKIYSELWTIWLWIVENENIYNKVLFTNPNSKSDIFINSDIIWNSKIF